MGKRILGLDFLKTFFERLNEDRIFGLASQLAYTFLFSMFPFLIFLFSLLPYLGLSPESVLSFIQEFAPPELITIIKSNIHHVLEKNGGLLSFGVIATIWPMSSAIMTIRAVLNQAYGVKETRNFFAMWGMVFLFTLGMIMVTIFALILNVFGPMVGRFGFHLLNISESFLHLWTLFRLLISFIMIFLVFGCLYFVSPSKHLRLKDVSIGAAIAAFVWQIASLAFSFIVDKYLHYSATYGTLASVVVIMTWFYISGLILLLGGEINVVIHQRWREKHESEQTGTSN